MLRLLPKTIITLFLSLYLFIFISVPHVSAQACEDRQCTSTNQDQNKQCIQEKIACLETILKDEQSKKATFTSAISVLNGEISIQQLQIQQTLTEINQLETQITDLSNRIEGLNVSLDRLTTIMMERVRNQYKKGKISPFAMMADATSFNDLVSQHKYVSAASKQTVDAMQRAENQKQVYDEQKNLKEVKQKEVEAKRLQLQGQQNDLNSKKAEQQKLLSETQGNEKKFQQIIAQAQKELSQIQNAASTVIRVGNEVQVRRGEVIGTMGSSGNSTGAHLHFSAYRYSFEQFANTGSWGWYYSNHLDPLTKLKPKDILWATGCGNDPNGTQNSGSGDWEWPMSTIRVTQNYGSNTCYNYMYGGRAHPALDLVGSGDISVKAVADGDAYFCRNCLGDGANGVFIFHDDNYMTVYWHLR